MTSLDNYLHMRDELYTFIYICTLANTPLLVPVVTIFDKTMFASLFVKYGAAFLVLAVSTFILMKVAGNYNLDRFASFIAACTL